jgi:hypothetical protein
MRLGTLIGAGGAVEVEGKTKMKGCSLCKTPTAAKYMCAADHSAPGAEHRVKPLLTATLSLK